MGIPRLTSYLSPYAVSTVLGCQKPGCLQHRLDDTDQSNEVIIDGPSFAYTIYERLIKNKPSYLDALGALPSYHETGLAFVWFLAELEKCGIIIKRIYFDGFLPSHKANIRIERLEDLVRKLIVSRFSHPHGFQNLDQGNHSNDAGSSNLLTVSARRSTFRGLPPAPFFIPAILEAIASGEYAKITSVVAGEAEAYCAHEVRQNGAIVLSNDSDVLIYDLGTGGSVGSLHQLTILIEENESGESHRVVQTTVIKPQDVAQILGLENLQQLACALQIENSSLQQAVNCAKTIEISSADSQKTLHEYVTEPSVSESENCLPSILHRLHANSLTLDPRISEFILQSHTHSPSIYLPIMIEDPTQTSAFAISIPTRTLAYSYCTLLHQTQQQTILEYSRKGENISPTSISLLSVEEIIQHATRIRNRLKQYRDVFSRYSVPTLWRIYALAEVYHWHLDTSRTPPKRQKMASLLRGHTSGGLSWETIHLTAQVEASLYSLRILKQVLSFVSPLIMTDDLIQNGLIEEMKALDTDLRALPPLAEVMPSRGELMAAAVEVDVDELLDLLARVLRGEIGEDDGGGGPEVGAGQVIKSRKRRRKRLKK